MLPDFFYQGSSYFIGFHHISSSVIPGKVYFLDVVGNAEIPRILLCFTLGGHFFLS